MFEKLKRGYLYVVLRIESPIRKYLALNLVHDKQYNALVSNKSTLQFNASKKSWSIFAKSGPTFFR